MLKPIIFVGAVLALIQPATASAQSDGDRAAARANFRQADANGDGRLNRGEFRAFIDANADDGLGRAPMVRRFGAYDRAFARVDGNDDGVVTPGELSAAGNE